MNPVPSCRFPVMPCALRVTIYLLNNTLSLVFVLQVQGIQAFAVLTVR